ncbi:MAG: hypothetical protein OXD44_03310 [Gammaproteobacteria bacterium]|nr:hypothetical protein [Gammaproteobacteria bacterium]MCY4226217.1 hypothetical protein [Gammaproteobacteria bacterium]MCY4312721.1 hypothetical protein [Gammaproteobacteria bacterium]
MDKNTNIERLHQRIQAFPSVLRITIGISLLIGGVFGMLPILGFWMFPLGLVILSVDFPWAQRAYRYLEDRIHRYSQARKKRKEKR